MARQTIRTTTVLRRRKSSNTGTHPCPYCHGTGRKKNTGRGGRKW